MGSIAGLINKHGRNVSEQIAHVDSAFEYAALISSAQISKRLMNDTQSYENYMAYANDIA